MSEKLLIIVDEKKVNIETSINEELLSFFKKGNKKEVYAVFSSIDVFNKLCNNPKINCNLVEKIILDQNYGNIVSQMYLSIEDNENFYDVVILIASKEHIKRYLKHFLEVKELKKWYQVVIIEKNSKQILNKQFIYLN